VASDVKSAHKALFGPFELDTQTAELFKNGKKVPLSGRSAQLLVLLAQRAGQLVSREELRLALWAQDTYVDFDHGLNNSISRIRQALGDSAESPRYIETLPKQGYRLIGEVRVLDDAPPIPPEPPAPFPPDPSQRRSRRSLWWAAAAVASGFTLATAFF